MGGDPETATKFFKNCIALMKGSTAQSDSEKMLGDCYGNLAVTLNRSKEDQSEALQDAYNQSRFFQDRASKDAGLDQAFSDSDTLRRAETVLVDLAIDSRNVLDQADRYAEKQRLLAMQAYNGSKDESHTDSLARAWAYGSWYKLLNHHPELAEQYAREALRLKEEDLLSPNSEAGKVAAVNLAHALLFLNRIDEAENIYNAIKDIKKSKSQSMSVVIAEDFAALRNLKLTHPGMCTIGKLVGDATYAKADCAAIN